MNNSWLKSPSDVMFPLYTKTIHQQWYTILQGPRRMFEMLVAILAICSSYELWSACTLSMLKSAIPSFYLSNTIGILYLISACTQLDGRCMMWSGCGVGWAKFSDLLRCRNSYFSLWFVIAWERNVVYQSHQGLGEGWGEWENETRDGERRGRSTYGSDN